MVSSWITDAGVAAAALAFVSLAAYTAPARSQDAILVTAPRFVEDARVLPAHVTVLGVTDIERSAARTLPELLQQQSGITMRDLVGNNAASTAVDLRGWGATASQNTLILLDGRRLNDFDLSGVQWSAIPLASIARIEIVRGSGAVLYGDGASSGVINIITHSPLKDERGVRISGRKGSFGTTEQQFTGSHANDVFGVNATVYGYHSDGYRRNSRNEQQNNSVNLRWALGEGALTLRASTDQQDQRLPGGLQIQDSLARNDYAADPRATNTPADAASRDGLRAGLAFTQRFGDLELSIDLDTRTKDARTFAVLGGFPSYRADDLDLVSFSPRIRLPFATGSVKHSLTVGFDQNAWRYRSRRTNLPDNLAQPTNRVAVDQDSSAFYVRDLVTTGPATHLTLGWRTERARYAARDAVDTTAPGCAFCAAAPAARDQQREHAWEAGLRHALSERWTLLARAGRSFRLVNAEEIYENDALFAPQFQFLLPQHATTLEGGAEWRAAGLQASLNLFRTNVRNEIHLDPFSTGVGNTNLPPSRRQGLTLDGRWQASAALGLRAGYTWTDARFLEGVLPGAAFAIATNIDIRGRRVPLVPEHKLNAAFDWRVAPRTVLTGMLTAVSSQFLDNDEPNSLGRKIPAWMVADLKLTHETRWGRAGIAINNLFDRKYYVYAVRSQFTADRYNVHPLPGRTIMLDAEVRFE